MRQHPCLNRCAPTRSPVNTCRGHVRGYHVSRTIYDKHIVSLYSPLEPVHRVHILAHAVRPSLLLSGGLAGMFPHVFAAGLLLLSTFLRCYKLLSVIRWLKGGEYFRASRKATWPCNSIFMWVQAPPLRCRGASISPSLATGPQRAEAGVNGGIGKPQS